MEKPAQPVWEKRSFQFLMLLVLWLVLLYLVLPPILAVVYSVRSILLPFVLGLALAYAANPVINWLEKRKVPRPVSALVFLLAMLGAIVGMMVWLVPTMRIELKELLGNLPGYFDRIVQWIGLDLPPVGQMVTEKAQGMMGASAQGMEAATQGAGAATQEMEAATQGAAQEGGAQMDLAAIARGAARVLDIGYDVIASTIGLVTYLVMAGLLIAFTFFYMSWKFEQTRGWFVPLIPAASRPQALKVAARMDHSVSAFIRGRLIQAVVMATVLTVGWLLAGVPYAVLLGVMGGLLNLIPFAASLAWVVAATVAVVEQFSGDGEMSMWVFIWPSGVYFLAQALDNWVVEPSVQGKATEMNPLTILLAVLIGGSLAGLLGVLIAIPLTACLRILAQDVLLPWWREKAAALPPATERP
jgi:predicted PurR-regulated permease PerM